MEKYPMESILCLLSFPRDGIRENFLNLTSSPFPGVVRRSRSLFPTRLSTARLLLPAQLYLPHPCGRVPDAVLPPPSLGSYQLLPVIVPAPSMEPFPLPGSMCDSLSSFQR